MALNPSSEFLPDFEEKISKFRCQQCNECCKKPGFVYLQKGEDDRIAESLGLNVRGFIERYCDLIDRQKIVLKKHSNEHCVFLDDKGCQIHAVKPQQCRDFPIQWRTPASFEYCSGLKALAL